MVGNKPGKISSGSWIIEGLEFLAEGFKVILEGVGVVDGS